MKTLFELLDDHVQHQRAVQLSPYTVRHGFYNVRRFLKWLAARWGVLSPDQLRVEHLEGFQKHLASVVSNRGRPLVARSINKIVDNLQGFLAFMVRHGHVPAGLMDAIQPVKEPNLLPGSVLTHEQVRKLIAQIDTGTPEGYQDRTVLEVLYSSGIRVGELLGMDVADVDYRNAMARVLGKGRKERMVPLGRTALRFLEGYVRAVRPHLTGDPGQKALFLAVDGKRQQYNTLRKLIHDCAGRAGLTVIVTPHTFRRSCATEMLRAGAGMYHVKEMLGHESLDTLRHYAKLTITDLQATHRKCHPREKDEE